MALAAGQHGSFPLLIEQLAQLLTSVKTITLSNRAYITCSHMCTLRNLNSQKETFILGMIITLQTSVVGVMFSKRQDTEHTRTQ